MFLRPYRIAKDGKAHAYWSLVGTVGTPDGPRQRAVCYLGELNSSAQSRWLKAIEVFNEQGGRGASGVFDRGIVSEENLASLRKRGGQYGVVTLAAVALAVIHPVALAPGAAGNFTVQHFLGRKPLGLVIQLTSNLAIWLQTPASDATNLYLSASAAGFGSALVG